MSVVADTVMFLDSPGERPAMDRPRDGERSDGFGGEESDPGSAGELVGVGVGVGAEDDDLVF